MENRIFNIPLTQTTFAEWSKRHYKHYKKMQISQDSIGGAPDLRACFCWECMEIFIMGFINDGGIDGL
jgi:fatty-acid desaturase